MCRSQATTTFPWPINPPRALDWKGEQTSTPVAHTCNQVSPGREEQDWETLAGLVLALAAEGFLSSNAVVILGETTAPITFSVAAAGTLFALIAFSEEPFVSTAADGLLGVRDLRSLSAKMFRKGKTKSNIDHTK